MATLSNILDLVDLGQFALPEFQRGYVWNRDQVRGLFASLYRRHPVGSLLAWTTESSSAPSRGDGQLAPGVVKLILDGQQRITSIYGVARGKPPPFFDGNAKTFSGLSFNVETEEFSFYTSAMKGNPLWLDVTKLLQPDGQGVAFKALIAANLGESNITTYLDRVGKLHTVLAIDIHVQEVTEQDVEIVVEIFNKLNSGGTKLSKGDLALARICAGWPDAREQMKSAIARWSKGDFEIALDLLLRSTNTVATGEAKFEHLHGVSSKDFREALLRTEKAIDTTLEHIQSRLGVDHDRVFFGRYALPVMTHFVARKSAQKLTAAEWDGLLFWYLQNAMWGRYSGSVESVLDKDLAALEQLEGGIERLIQELRLWRGGGLRVQAHDFRGSSMGSRFYPLLYVLTRGRGARDFVSGVELKASLLGKQSRLEVHHIFPKAQLYKAGYGKGEVNAVANFCFLTADSNKVVSDTLPEEYLPDIEEKNPGVLASQWIPDDPKLWKLGSYRDFLEARRELLAAAANALLSSLHDLPPEVTGSARPAIPELPGGFDSAEQEEKVEEVRAWMREQGLPEGSVLYELPDPATEQPVAILDLAWPDGIQPGLSQPAALLIDENAVVLSAASGAGFRCLTSVAQLKKYVKSLGLQAA